MYLENLIDKLKEVQQTGIDSKGMHFTVKFKFICEAPIRAYLRCIKRHNSVHSCEKCEQEESENYHKFTALYLAHLELMNHFIISLIMTITIVILL